ncbi:tetratricopeptide repeat protein [Umezawaea tangerina]|uniref:Tetratricopeptide repeat protein n=1 Tax=Umezawaea tangerina TaxID=84725 RepID=A0A2T0TH45_9PSEU|nr:tetratricopeptide repeat protein [Umezawaea tangerina]
MVQAGVIHQVTLAPVHQRERPPRQLPLAVRDFIGRGEHLAALSALLPNGAGNSGAASVVISAVDGTAGIGKTALALHWGHAVEHHFPDGTLYANLRGYGPGEPATSDEVLESFLRALGTQAERMPVGVEAKASAFRSLLAGRRLLLVLDNARSADQVRPLLPGVAGCVVVVTSRDSLTGLVVTESAHRLTLDVLSEHEARRLVESIAGEPRTKAEPKAVTDLVRLCARLPLALRIAAGRVTVHEHYTFADVVSELEDDHQRLGVLSRGNDERAALRAVFDRSYEKLRPDQARMFRRLGLHVGPEISVHAAAAVAELDLPTAHLLLEDLTNVHLIEQCALNRYKFHDLLRAYAADLAHRYDITIERELAVKSLLNWYTHTAWVYDAAVFPAHTRLPLRIPVPQNPMPAPDSVQALRWLNIEEPALLSALRKAAKCRMHKLSAHLAEGARFLVAKGAWKEQHEALAVGLSAARQTGDQVAETCFCIMLGETFINMRRWSEAFAILNHGLLLARDLDDNHYPAMTLNELGYLCIEQERFEDALEYLTEALPLSRGVDTGRTEAVVECNLAAAHNSLHLYEDALVHGDRSLVLRHRSGDLIGKGPALHQFARAWNGLGRFRLAADLCSEAISAGDTYGNLAEIMAGPLETLAVSLENLGHRDESNRCLQDAARLYDDYGYPWRARRVRDALARSS